MKNNVVAFKPKNNPQYHCWLVCINYQRRKIIKILKTNENYITYMAICNWIREETNGINSFTATFIESISYIGYMTEKELLEKDNRVL